MLLLPTLALLALGRAAPEPAPAPGPQRGCPEGICRLGVGLLGACCPRGCRLQKELVYGAPPDPPDRIALCLPRASAREGHTGEVWTSTSNVTREAPGATRPAPSAGGRYPPARVAPSLFIIGVGKAGTSSLWTLLKRHPHIRGASEVFKGQGDQGYTSKELEYFGNPRFEKGQWFYLRHFPECAPSTLSRSGPPPPSGAAAASPGAGLGDGGFVTIDASPGYLESSVAAGQLAASYDHADRAKLRFVVVLRHPAAQLQSWFHFVLQHFSSCARKGSDDRGNSVCQCYKVYSRGRGSDDEKFARYANDLLSRHHSYMSGGVAQGLERWLEHFKPEQIMVVTQDELRRDNGTKVANDVAAFAGLARYRPGRAASNAAKTPYRRLDAEMSRDLMALAVAHLRKLSDLLAVLPGASQETRDIVRAWHDEGVGLPNRAGASDDGAADSGGDGVADSGGGGGGSGGGAADDPPSGGWPTGDQQDGGTVAAGAAADWADPELQDAIGSIFGVDPPDLPLDEGSGGGENDGTTAAAVAKAGGDTMGDELPELASDPLAWAAGQAEIALGRAPYHFK